VESVTGVLDRGSRRRTSRQPAAEQLSRADRVALGKDRRGLVPLDTHAEFEPDKNRDPVGLLLSQAKERVPELVPIRHGRMLVSPFTFYRGAALPMAADLSTTPASGFRTQLCGDAHLSNFGAFASPARRLVFDLNDFDETLPGPFEWDVKRLAASFSVAARDNEMSAKVRHGIAGEVAESYRMAMREFAGQSYMSVWYAYLDIEQELRGLTSDIKTKRVKRVESMMRAAHNRDSLHALNKLTTVVNGRREIVSDPPTVVPIEEIFTGHQATEITAVLHEVLSTYRRSLQSDRKYLFDQFTLQRVARKVVGVGSVGTRAWIVLMDGGDDAEPLFLQAKEAGPSVLARYCGKSQYQNEGERVVAGQLLMQAQSDIFLGWTRVSQGPGGERDFYVRQLRDWKFSVPVEQMRPAGLRTYARICGWTLARAHARSGDRIGIAAYLGNSARFDQAIASFAEAYADQNERDYAAFQEAARSGKIEVINGI
jgi:uncharacterized protein (DUF2252 family)